jgi:hypothetical protein
MYEGLLLFFTEGIIYTYVSIYVAKFIRQTQTQIYTPSNCFVIAGLQTDPGDRF